MQKIVGYKKLENQNFEPIYEEIPEKTNNMRMNLSMIDTNTIEGRLLIASISQLSSQGEYTSKEPDQILNEMKGIVDHIYENNPLPEIKMEERPSFSKALESLINRYSKENDSNTPDFILAAYLEFQLKAYENTVTARDKWFGVNMLAEDKKAKNE